MSILARELQRLAGPMCQAAVTTSIKRWEEKIRERVRLEMALKLTDDSGGGRQVQRVGIEVSDGLPLALEAAEADLEIQVAEIAGMFRPDLTDFIDSADSLKELLYRLAGVDNQWRPQAEAASVKIDDLHVLASELVELAARSKLPDAIKRIDQDILGVYFSRGRHPKSWGPPAIDIYWAVIGAVGKMIGADPEALTLVVLTHELAHAYSHLGADTDGNRWSDASFSGTDVPVKEGIAQYYTEKIMRWFTARDIVAPQHAFSSLLQLQAPPYRIHEQWAKEFSPECVRAAIIEFRNSHLTKTEDFVRLMGAAGARLGRRRAPAGQPAG